MLRTDGRHPRVRFFQAHTTLALAKTQVPERAKRHGPPGEGLRKRPYVKMSRVVSQGGDNRISTAYKLHHQIALNENQDRRRARSKSGEVINVQVPVRDGSQKPAKKMDCLSKARALLFLFWPQHQQEKRQSACKPGSVGPGPRAARTWRPFIWDDRCRPPLATNPDGELENALRRGRPRLAVPIRFCSRWGLPCRSALPRSRCALTAPFHPCHSRGGLLSVALSLGSPPPDVIRHRVSMEPGLSSPA